MQSPPATRIHITSNQDHDDDDHHHHHGDLKSQPYPPAHVPPPTSKYNNRGHPLFRATATSREDISPILNFLRYAQGLVVPIVGFFVMRYAKVEGLYCVLASIITSFSAKAIKKIVKQPRPDGAAVKSHGMPSTHSATVVFLTQYPLLHYIDNFSRGRPLTLSQLFAIAILLIYPSAVMWSRIALGVHTPAQVFAGGVLGLFYAVQAWSIWNGRSPAVGTADLAQSMNAHPLVLAIDRVVYAHLQLMWDIISNRQ